MSLFCGGSELANAEGRNAHPGVRDSGQFWPALAPTPLWMTCTAFGSSVSVHLRVLDPARISKSLKHFGFKKCFHNISYHKTRHNTLASRLLIPLQLIFFRSRRAIFTASPKKMAGSSPSGSVPSGSSSGWQHHFVTLIDASRGPWNTRNVKWACLICNPLDVLLVTWCPSCPCLFLHMPFLTTLLPVTRLPLGSCSVGNVFANRYLLCLLIGGLGGQGYSASP